MWVPKSATMLVNVYSSLMMSLNTTLLFLATDAVTVRIRPPGFPLAPPPSPNGRRMSAFAMWRMPVGGLCNAPWRTLTPSRWPCERPLGTCWFWGLSGLLSPKMIWSLHFSLRTALCDARSTVRLKGMSSSMPQCSSMLSLTSLARSRAGRTVRCPFTGSYPSDGTRNRRV